MKPTMLFAIIMLTAIVIAASFGLQFGSTESIKISADMAPNVLYVCPATGGAWDTFATSVRPFVRYVTIFFFSVSMILMFHWGWNLYQNLLKDKFERKAFTNSWMITKFVFWMIIIFIIATYTPNYFRSVRVDGNDASWVLCESNTPGARAVRADAVH